MTFWIDEATIIDDTEIAFEKMKASGFNDTQSKETLATALAAAHERGRVDELERCAAVVRTQLGKARPTEAEKLLGTYILTDIEGRKP